MDISGGPSRNPAPPLESEVNELTDHVPADREMMDSNSKATNNPGNPSDVESVIRRAEEVANSASSSGAFGEEAAFKEMFGYSRPAGGTEPTKSQRVTYEDLNDELKLCVDLLRGKIGNMPQRKLVHYLKLEISVEQILPLIAVNRDSVVALLGISATTFKVWIHEGLGMARWPSRSVRMHNDACLRFSAEVLRELFKEEKDFNSNTLTEKMNHKSEAEKRKSKLEEGIRKAGHEAREKFLSNITKATSTPVGLATARK